MRKNYDIGDTVTVINDGMQVAGEVLAKRGFWIFTKYAVGYKCTDRVMRISCDTVEWFKYSEVLNENQIPVQKTIESREESTAKEQTEAEEAVEHIAKHNSDKYRKRNMLIAILTMLMAVLILPYGLKTDNIVEKIWIMLLVIAGIVIGSMLVVCEISTWIKQGKRGTGIEKRM